MCIPHVYVLSCASNMHPMHVCPCASPHVYGMCMPQAELAEFFSDAALPKEVRDARGRTARMEWIDCNRISDPRYAGLYASHRIHVDQVMCMACSNMHPMHVCASG